MTWLSRSPSLLFAAVVVATVVAVTTAGTGFWVLMTLIAGGSGRDVLEVALDPTLFGTSVTMSLALGVVLGLIARRVALEQAAERAGRNSEEGSSG